MVSVIYVVGILLMKFMDNKYHQSIRVGLLRMDAPYILIDLLNLKGINVFGLKGFYQNGCFLKILV